MQRATAGHSVRVTRLRALGWKKIVGLFVGVPVLLLVVLFGVVYARTTVPQPSKIATDEATRVLYADGSLIGKLGKNRTIVSLDQVSVDAQHAILAAEDRGFYSEPGISAKGIARALFTNLKGGGVSQGGSTITQQYAKNAFLTSERTFSRKIKEVFIALKMSQTVSKNKILEDYLNTIYFGRGAYGIQAAADTYFHEPASKLTAAQSAVLASSVRSPAGYDPARHLERAKARWAYVLDGMVKQSWLTDAQRAVARYPAVDKIKNVRDFPGSSDHLRERVIADLEKHGIAEDRITAGGLVIRTTIDAKAQVAAVQAVEGAIPASSKPNPAVGALVAVRPGDGGVVAYYGGRQPGGYDYADGQNGVQPGSSFKPYVLAAALDKGIGLTTQYDGSSPQNVCGKIVNNDPGDPPLRQIDLVKSLALSVNTVYTRLACDIGADRVANAARAAGIPDRDSLADGTGQRSPNAIALGVYEVRVIDQAVGYATFAAQGQRAAPYFVSSVSDHGNVVYRAKPDLTMAFSQGVAADTTYAMQQVVENGTGRGAQLAGRPAAGKTGTTEKNTNAWFCGFTPQLAAAVWVGREKGGPLVNVPNLDSGPNGVYGGTVPAAIFKAFMDKALQGQQAEVFPPRANVGQQAVPTPSPVPTLPSSSPTPTATVAPTTPPPTKPAVTPTPVRPTVTPPPAPTGPPPTSAPPVVLPLTASPAAVAAGPPGASPGP